MWWCSRYLWLTSKGVILLSKCGNFNNRPDNSDWCSWLGLLYPDVFGAWYIFQGVNCRCYGRGRCHMPDNSSSDKLHAFFVFILCYKTYSFSKIHSIVHSNVHYCSLSFTLAIYLLSGINRCINFAPSIRKWHIWLAVIFDLLEQYKRKRKRKRKRERRRRRRRRQRFCYDFVLTINIYKHFKHLRLWRQ